ncbi:MAG TPA: SRPBCC family protein [Solirubrobacteraceae bacterium]
MSVVTASTHIAAPREEVWKMVMDPRRLHDWVTIHRKLVQADDGPARVGFAMEQQIHLRGVSLDVRWKLVEYEPCEKAVWEGRGPAHSRARTEYVLRDERDGTRFDYRNEFRAPLGVVGALASRALVGGMPEREAKRTLDRLRAALEKQFSSTG